MQYVVMYFRNFGMQPKKDDSRKILPLLFLITIFFVWREIIVSGHLFFCVICLVVWIFIFMTFEYLLKKKVKKSVSLWEDYEKKYPIIVEYAPPKWINPAEAWLLYNRSVEPTDLTSMIYQWKFEKFIDIKSFKWKNSKIEYIKLIKLKELPQSRPLFETGIFNSIFHMWNIKIIEWAFQLRYALMLEDLECYWIQKWWIYREKSDMKKSKYIFDKFWWFIFLVILCLFILIPSMIVKYLEISIDFFNLMWFTVVILLAISWVVLVYWNIDRWWRLKFTDKWAELASHVIWYSRFIKSCDENKINMLLKEDPLFIDRTLPYATAFWMETEFLNKISPLMEDWNAKYAGWKKIPSWVWMLSFFIWWDNLHLF